MRGKVDSQINKIFHDSKIFQPDTKKHDDKEAARSVLAAEGRSSTSQAIASKTNIHSYSTIESYKNTWHQVGHHAREKGLKDLGKIESRHIQSYLEKRISDGVALQTWKKEAAHCGKLGNALAAFRGGKEIDFRPTINDLRGEAKTMLSNPDNRMRGFTDPNAVLSEIRGADHLLRAEIQLQGGAREHEVWRLDAAQLRGENRLELTNTKGGKPRTITVSAQTYAKLVTRLNEGPMKTTTGAYRSEIYRASGRAGEIQRGTHDFRYCYAQGRYTELTRAGEVPEIAHQTISREMGHERADITLHYLS